MCPHKGYGFSRLFGLKTGTEFAHFGLETGMVFDGTTGVYELFIVSIPTVREMCEFEMDFKKFFLLLFLST